MRTEPGGVLPTTTRWSRRTMRSGARRWRSRLGWAPPIAALPGSARLRGHGRHGNDHADFSTSSARSGHDPVLVWGEGAVPDRADRADRGHRGPPDRRPAFARYLAPRVRVREPALDMENLEHAARHDELA